jgi:hypothetical protein
VLFNRLSVYGNKITLEIRGLSNKFRLRKPETPPTEVSNYVMSHYMRRVYVLHYVRPGDEYFRHLDSFQLVKSGYEWVNTFQRLDHRKVMAYSKYFIDNIADPKDRHQPAVEQEAWAYYDAFRAKYPNAGDKLPDLKATLKDRADQ